MDEKMPENKKIIKRQNTSGPETTSPKTENRRPSLSSNDALQKEI